MQTIIKANTSVSKEGIARLDDMVNKYYSVADVKEDEHEDNDDDVDEVDEEEAAAASIKAAAERYRPPRFDGGYRINK